MGAWVSYGLGSENDNLPAFVVLLSQAHAINTDQPLFSRLWSQRVSAFQSSGRPFPRRAAIRFCISKTRRESRERTRRRMLDTVAALNRKHSEQYGDPEIQTRIRQYEMAYRMQTSVPDLMDLSKEPDSTFEMYGPESRKPGTYAANCLLARRLAERNVRFIQLYHRGWDQHNDLPRDLALQCGGTDQPTAALVADLKQRGLLEDTLVIWGGEFGRTVYSQGKLTEANYGRDHHPRCFTMWMAGGGVKAGTVTRRDRRFRLQHRQRSRPRPRPAGDHPALPGRRSHEADLLIPGPPFPSDRCVGAPVKQVLAQVS